MLTFQKTGAKSGVLLSLRDRQLAARRIEGDRSSRPTLIARDLAGEPSYAQHNGRLYCAYRTIDGALCVRDLSDNHVMCTLAPQEARYAAETLVCFGNRLLLFFFTEQDPNHGAKIPTRREPDAPWYRLCAFLPGEERMLFELPEVFPSAPTCVPVVVSENLFLHIYGTEYHKLIHVDADYNWLAISMSTQEDAARNRKLLLTQQQRIESLLDETRQKDAQIQRLTADIESAKRQYGELMQVAEQYRDEARKWASKILS